MNYQTQLDRWLERAVDDPDLIAELNAVKDNPEAVSDRFYRELAFGTGDCGASSVREPTA